MIRPILYNMIPIIILVFGGSYIVYAQVATTSPTASSAEITLTQSDAPLPIPSLTPSPTPIVLPYFQPTTIVPPFAIVATPSSPSPGESVTVEAQPSSFDATTANFTWTVDGVSRPDLSGIGKSSFAYTAGKIASRSRITVRVAPIDDNPITASLTVYVTDLVLTWTADTYIPKWYKGKALPIPNSVVHVAAIPTVIIDGDPIPAHKLIYTWNVNGQRKLRGAGLQTLTLQEPEQSWNTPIVALTIEDVTHQIHKEARTAVVMRNPRAVIYQSLPLGGVEFRRGTSAFFPIPPGTLDLQVEPFFFNTTSRYDLTYLWSIGGIPSTSTAQNPFLLTLDMSQQPSGIVALGVNVKGKNTNVSIPSANNFLTIPIQQQ